MLKPGDLTKRRSSLSPAKQVLLEKLRRGRAFDPRTAISRRAQQGPVALSYAQQRLWFLDLLEPGSSVYNLSANVQLSGQLDIVALALSLNEVVKRHEILRTSFDILDGQGVQIIEPNLTLSLPVIDLREHPPSDRQRHAGRLAREQARQPFDLKTGPLIRGVIQRLDDQEHIIVLTMHHIIADGWSVSLLVGEVAELYRAFTTGTAPLLPELPIQYADFALWQREWLQGEILDAEMDYWKQHLSGMPPTLDLLTDRARPAIQTFRGASQFLVMPRILADGLSALSQRSGTTLFMTLLAGFFALLQRYTGQDDICVGTPVAGRNRIEMERLIGFFVNTLVMRADLSANPRFIELLTRVKEMAMDSQLHQNLPFEKLVEELQPDRDLSRTPLFQVMFVFQNAPDSSIKLPGLSLNALPADSGMAKFDLTLSILDTGMGLKSTIDYNTDLFDAGTIQRLLQHYQTLLKACVDDPCCRISDLPLMSREEKKQIVEEWNDTRREYEGGETLGKLFEEQVRRTPEAVAVKYEEDEISYEELNRRANQVARYLKRRGVGTESRVGICMERSIEMVIGMLGVVKSGGAYVPIDASYPADRIEYMLGEAEVEVVLSKRGEWRGREGEVINVDEKKEEIKGERGEDLDEEIRGENLAYVIFTSGSTGKPKGVMISHGSVANFLFSMREQPGMRSGDTLLAVTSISFDIAALEIFLPLVVGARLVVASSRTAGDGRGLIESLDGCGATVMQGTPATWQLLLGSGWRGRKGLRILCGGEALSTELADQLRESGGRVWNLYGPTETTIWSGLEEVSEERRIVSIGRPIANTQMHIMDADLNVVPVGVPGELYIGGEGLARGYVKRAELTAERFIPDGTEGKEGRRLYKTGDVARYKREGEIEYLGRGDQQVKIRGYRIEPGEVEAILNEHPGVRESVVVAKGEGVEKRLVAYVTREGEEGPTVDEMRGKLKERLPGYMVPTTIEILEAMPLTLNGKVDRKALSAREESWNQRPETFVAPRTELEHILARMWQESLGLQQVGIYDDFFELGGDSIRGAVFINKLQAKLGDPIYVVSLFEFSNIAGFASYLADHHADRVDAMCSASSSRPNHELTPIRPLGRRNKKQVERVIS